MLVESCGCCGTPDGLGVTPAGVPHKYKTVKKLSKLDRFANIREDFVPNDADDVRYYGRHSVSFSAITDEWVVRNGLVYVSSHKTMDGAIEEAKKLSGKQDQNKDPWIDPDPVSGTMADIKNVTPSASSSMTAGPENVVNQAPTTPSEPSIPPPTKPSSEPMTPPPSTPSEPMSMPPSEPQTSTASAPTPSAGPGPSAGGGTIV